MGPHLLVDREVTCARGDRLLDRLRAGSGGVLLVEGEAGIGKTRLLTELTRRARERDCVVLTGCGAELEQEIPFGVVRQVFAPVAGQADATLAVVLGLSAGQDTPPGDPFAIWHALYWFCARLAERTPTVLLVDDLHWADQPSTRWLHY